MNSFHLASPLGSLSRLSHARTRSISPENPTGEKGRGGMATEGTGKDAARDLGPGWKISPSWRIEPRQTYVLADVEGPGVIQQIWMTPTGTWRNLILRIHWDGEENPSVECPVGDFFANGWGAYARVDSLAVCVNPGSAFNCYWPMPFRRRCRITCENRSDDASMLYFQINYALQDVPGDAGYFHAQFRRVNPVPRKAVYTILDGVEGWGHYAGTYMAWGVNNAGWWGEGEIKFYLDGDEYPTICGTGTEDYFCGSYNFENKQTRQYEAFNSAYAGLPQVIRPDGVYQSQTRFGLYRWHLTDPVRFEKDLRVTIQALGWRNGGRYLPLQDDISSVAFWYQNFPARPFPPLGTPDCLEIN
ncbi:MAG TPA: glycoside hydrolase family 172 protein [Rariglobus sp.]